MFVRPDSVGVPRLEFKRLIRLGRPAVDRTKDLPVAGSNRDLDRRLAGCRPWPRRCLLDALFGVSELGLDDVPLGVTYSSMAYLISASVMSPPAIGCVGSVIPLLPAAAVQAAHSSQTASFRTRGKCSRMNRFGSSLMASSSSSNCLALLETFCAIIAAANSFPRGPMHPARCPSVMTSRAFEPAPALRGARDGRGHGSGRITPPGFADSYYRRVGFG